MIRIYKDKEKIYQSKRKRIFSAPAVLIHKNERLTSLQMPLLTNITAANNARPLIKVTGNPNINDRKDFIPSAFLKHCGANPKSICYVDNAREYSEVAGWFILKSIKEQASIFFQKMYGVGILLYPL